MTQYAYLLNCSGTNVCIQNISEYFHDPAFSKKWSSKLSRAGQQLLDFMVLYLAHPQARQGGT